MESNGGCAYGLRLDGNVTPSPTTVIWIHRGSAYGAGLNELEHREFGSRVLPPSSCCCAFKALASIPAQIRHQFGTTPIGVPEMLRCAKELGLKARGLKTRGTGWPRTPLPGIAVLRDGGFLLLGKAGDDKILVQAPDAPRPN